METYYVKYYDGFEGQWYAQNVSSTNIEDYLAPLKKRYDRVICEKVDR